MVLELSDCDRYGLLVDSKHISFTTMLQMFLHLVHLSTFQTDLEFVIF